MSTHCFEQPQVSAANAVTNRATSGADRAIRISTATAVIAVAGIAAYVSYWHAYEVVRAHGEVGVTARLEPATIDGLVYASSMVVLYAARHQLPVPRLARWLLALGIVATVAANIAHGLSHGPVGAAVAAWPAASLVGSYELLLWLIRTAGQEERPSLGSDWLAKNWPAKVTEQAGLDYFEDENPERAAANAYRLSVLAGKPLSERRLAAMFGKTSRRWARQRMAEVRGEGVHDVTAGNDTALASSAV